MKNDPTFKFAAVAILAGVIAAFVNPAHQADESADTTAKTQTVSTTTATAGLTE